MKKLQITGLVDRRSKVIVSQRKSVKTVVPAAADRMHSAKMS